MKRPANNEDILRALLIAAACIAFVILILTAIIPKEKLNKVTDLLISTSKKNAESYFPAQKDRLGTVTVGSTIRFGCYEQDNNPMNGPEEIDWIVLAVDGDKALLISKYALDYKMFDEEDNSYVVSTWERSSLRLWLNDTFYNTAFSSGHQAMIVNSVVTADENPDYDTTPGRDTTDHIFVLSVNEAKRYFDSDSARQCRASAYCYAQGAEKGDGGACWWWLRTPGINFYSDAVVTARGAVYSAGFCNDNPAPAVRPAMWIDLGGT